MVACLSVGSNGVNDRSNLWLGRHRVKEPWGFFRWWVVIGCPQWPAMGFSLRLSAVLGRSSGGSRAGLRHLVWNFG